MMEPNTLELLYQYFKQLICTVMLSIMYASTAMTNSEEISEENV
jgi:hypothetical protein